MRSNLFIPIYKASSSLPYVAKNSDLNVTPSTNDGSPFEGALPPPPAPPLAPLGGKNSPPERSGRGRGLNNNLNSSRSWRRQSAETPFLSAKDQGTHSFYFLERRRNLKVILILSFVFKSLNNNELTGPNPFWWGGPLGHGGAGFGLPGWRGGNLKGKSWGIGGKDSKGRGRLGKF